MKFINSEELSSHITNETPDAKGGKMFGCRCIKMLKGKAGIMLKDDELIIKISGETFEEAPNFPMRAYLLRWKTARLTAGTESP